LSLAAVAVGYTFTIGALIVAVHKNFGFIAATHGTSFLVGFRGCDFTNIHLIVFRLVGFFLPFFFFLAAAAAAAAFPFLV